jgi:hypothetical protein
MERISWIQKEIGGPQRNFLAPPTNELEANI